MVADKWNFSNAGNRAVKCELYNVDKFLFQYLFHLLQYLTRRCEFAKCLDGLLYTHLAQYS